MTTSPLEMLNMRLATHEPSESQRGLTLEENTKDTPVLLQAAVDTPQFYKPGIFPGYLFSEVVPPKLAVPRVLPPGLYLSCIPPLHLSKSIV
jgi:hypothetical protein